jgi:hypothetical protein
VEEQNNRLASFRSDEHSQNGEDGVVAEIFKRLDIRLNERFWCVEFGAWDGIHFSNTFSLVENHGAQALYIEGDIRKFRDLLETASRFPSIVPAQSFLAASWNGHDSLVTPAFTGTFDSNSVALLDDILANTAVPQDYDLLSIDIDSYDLEVWQSHRAFKAKVVVIEINSSLPPGILQWHGPGREGNSFSSTIAVAARKGYTLVCHTGNLIFVRNDLVGLVGLTEIDRNFPERLFDYSWQQSR